MRLPTLSTALTLALALVTLDGVSAKKAKCLPSGDHVPINEALLNGGKGTTVNLCPGSVHRLNASIRFTAPSQMLTTLGGPTGRDRAMLVVEGEAMATAIYADCKECSYATISHLIIDGNRPQLLRVPLGEALIEIGNGHDQRVTHCRLYEPRGWSALHVREGDSLNCRKAYIADNEIGPCGEEWDDDYDGLVEKEPPYGNPRADGISVACKDSMVERNVVFDATDGAIVLFGSEGTEVRENDIYSRTRVVLGGVNLVDYDPWKGDYSRVKVHHNRFWANGRYFKVGIVTGPSSWSDDTDTVVRGATVTDNTFSGAHFGYAIVVSSSEGFTVQRNKVADDAVFSGVPGPSCPSAPENSPPTPFLINRGSARGSYQSDFVNGEVQHIICIQPPPDANGNPYKPWRMRDSPAALAAKAAENPAIAAGLEGRLADALVAYQVDLLVAIKDIEARLDGGAKGKLKSKSKAQHNDRAGNYKEPIDYKEPLESTPELEALNGIEARIAALEASGAKLSTNLDVLGRELAHMRKKHLEMADTTRPVMQDLYNTIKKAKDDKAGKKGSAKAGDHGDHLGFPVNGTLLLAGGALVAVVLVLVRKMRKMKPKAYKLT